MIFVAMSNTGPRGMLMAGGLLVATLGFVGGAGWRGVGVGGFAVHAPLSELVQAQFLPGRSGDPRDALFDVVGVGLGAVVGVLLRRRVAPPRAGRID
ncbi:MAG TPA: hypothetical protein PKC73_09845 [Dermatophilaceae bacterium]|nr:hypothetical protein [Dermatophilaceae bacterium]